MKIVRITFSIADVGWKWWKNVPLISLYSIIHAARSYHDYYPVGALILLRNANVTRCCCSFKDGNMTPPRSTVKVPMKMKLAKFQFGYREFENETENECIET